MKTGLIIFVFFTSFLSCAQDFEGKIIYNISFKDSLGQAIEGMDDQKIAEYLNDTILRVDQNSRAGLQTTLINFNDSTYHILMDMGSIKVAIIMPDEVFVTADSLQPRIKYKCKSKKIAGYKCKLALVTDHKGDTKSVYYAKKIPGKYNQKFEGLKGYPMSYDLNEQGFTLHFEATEVDLKEVDKAYLSIPDDYRVMTMEEFMKAVSE